MTPRERTIELIETIENTMDEHNGMFGELGTLCTFCGSGSYDGFSGILHKPDCLIRQMRDWLLMNRCDAKQKDSDEVKG